MLGVHKNAHLVSLQNVQPLPIIKSANSVCHLYRMYGEIPIEFFAIEIFVADCQRWKKNTLGKKTWGRFIEERQREKKISFHKADGIFPCVADCMYLFISVIRGECNCTLQFLSRFSESWNVLEIHFLYWIPALWIFLDFSRKLGYKIVI